MCIDWVTYAEHHLAYRELTSLSQAKTWVHQCIEVAAESQRNADINDCKKAIAQSNRNHPRVRRRSADQQTVIQANVCQESAIFGLIYRKSIYRSTRYCNILNSNMSKQIPFFETWFRDDSIGASS